MSDTTAKRPKSKRWQHHGLRGLISGVRRHEPGPRTWTRGGLKVLSEVAEMSRLLIGVPATAR